MVDLYGWDENMALLHFKPIPRQIIWGGDVIKNYYGYDWMPDNVGQAWAFAAQPTESNECLTDPYKGLTLKDLWEKHSELFGDTDRLFPVIVSLLGPVKDLSIQVHPDTENARKAGFLYGKNECWYFLEAEPDSKIVFGHNAKNEEDLRKYIAEGRWDDLIDHLDVSKDDFVYIPSGLLHACCKGVCAYEVQQSTDVTYRFYDYDRVDAQGNKRELHLEKAIETLSYDKSAMVNIAHPVAEEIPGGIVTHLISNESFTVTKVEVDGQAKLPAGTYQLVTVARGSGVANGENVQVGSQFLLPRGEALELSGKLTLMMTTA